ncbi:MAG: Phenylalanine--tRNA ligase beta subunit [Owenweeksia sp. TMED14]|nr:MAG: Phenylalanine--tRNA ligase beta subunit [Owenweeksia sp. TMED14]
MLISKDWLSDYIKTDISIEIFSKTLTSIGLEVEKIDDIDQVRGGLHGVLVGEIISLNKHPNADRLCCTVLDMGNDKFLNIVCGASNIEVGQKVPVAIVGSTIYPNDLENGLKIKKGKIRGKVSEGMLCAQDELGLGNSHDGIYILNDNAIKGAKLSEHLNLRSDSVFDIGLTPNRMDAMSHMGVARDLKAALIQNKTDFSWNQVKLNDWLEATSNIKININDESACPSYKALTITGLSNTSSPDWLVRRLKAIGLKPINAIVDITNYVLHDLGQPLHAFDAKSIPDNNIIVRRAKKDELFTTLDGQERKLHEEDLVIANSKTPIALAGVFGGLHSGVNQDSTSIILESAWFDPVVIRKTAKRYGLNTDASFRYERGVDPNIGYDALKLAWTIFKSIFPNALVTSFSEKKSKNASFRPRIIEVNLDRINKLIGADILKSDVKSILNSLDINQIRENGSSLTLSVPCYRWDVTREADIAEEILRIYGFNRIPFPSNMRFSLSQNKRVSNESLHRKATEFLVAKGLYEIINNSLTSSELYSLHPSIDESKLVKILNPLSQELGVMRPTLLMGGLDAISYNTKRQQTNISFFEFGRTYHSPNKNEYSEQNNLGLWLAGEFPISSWSEENSEINFFKMKGLATGLLAHLGIHKITEVEQHSIKGQWDSGICFEVNKKTIATIGFVDEWALEKVDLNQKVLAAIFNWDEICKIAKNVKIKYKETPKFPMVKRDLAILVKSEIPYSSILNVIKNSNVKSLINIELFDVYQGEKISKDNISFGIRLSFQDINKTLKDSQVEKSITQIVKILNQKVEAEIRSS